MRNDRKENWFDRIESSEGSIQEKFSQGEHFPESAAGHLCVPLSILWLNYWFITKTARASNFNDHIREQMPAIPDIGNKIAKTVDDPLWNWQQRSYRIKALYTGIAGQTRYLEKIVNGEKQLPNWMVENVMVIVKTRCKDHEFWPKELLDNIDPQKKDTWIKLLTPSNIPVRLPPWIEIIKYNQVHDLVRIYSFNSLKFQKHTNFIDIDKSKDDCGLSENLADGEGYKLFVLYTLNTNPEDSQILMTFKGHMMAMRVEANGVTFFDPNCGTAFFEKAPKFQAWFGQNWKEQYGKAFGNGACVKTFTSV